MKSMKAMKTWILAAALISFFSAAPGALAGQGHGGHGGADHGKAASALSAGTYEHKAVVEGIRTEFQIMSLASMNMKDPNGATHHVMLKLFDDRKNEPIQKIAGKVKIVAPSGKEQVATLADYSGIYAANFLFDEKGKYGVICLFQESGNKHVVKFWYPHEG